MVIFEGKREKRRDAIEHKREIETGQPFLFQHQSERRKEREMENCAPVNHEGHECL